MLDEMCAGDGRRSIPPERLLEVMPSIALYSVRSGHEANGIIAALPSRTRVRRTRVDRVM